MACALHLHELPCKSGTPEAITLLTGMFQPRSPYTDTDTKNHLRLN